MHTFASKLNLNCLHAWLTRFSVVVSLHQQVGLAWSAWVWGVSTGLFVFLHFCLSVFWSFCFSFGGEYFVEIGSDDLPTSALREGDFSLGGRTTRSFGGELRGSSRSGGNGFGFSWGGGGLGASWGGDNRDLSRYCGGVFDLSLEEV